MWLALFLAAPGQRDREALRSRERPGPLCAPTLPSCCEGQRCSPTDAGMWALGIVIPAPGIERQRACGRERNKGARSVARHPVERRWGGSGQIVIITPEAPRYFGSEGRRGQPPSLPQPTKTD